MCGICGFIRRAGLQEKDQDILQCMTEVIFHRGPDDGGYYLDSHAALANRRLSIIDLASGHQPMTNEDETIQVVYNGEIYNYKELRSELEGRGHRFTTNSDTETIVHGYEEWGYNIASRLRGMFAIAVWDVKEHRLVLIRDPLGIKPLYYCITAQNDIVFGSEIKALVTHPDVPRRLDPAALDAFLTLEYIPAPASIFRDIRKLPPGHVLSYRNGRYSILPYWDVPLISIPAEERDSNLLVTELKERLQESVRLHMISDVPVGAFLSGGLDSSTVVAWMSKVSQEPILTFSIGFQDETYNELPYAQRVAEYFQTKHTERILPYNIVNTVDDLLKFLDEPFGDFSIFPTYLVSRAARDYVKVILSGDGGDEIFAGYEHYIAWKIDRTLRWIPFPLRRWAGSMINRWFKPSPAKKGWVNRLRRFGEGWQHPDEWDHVRYMLFLLDEQKSQLYTDGLLEELRNENVGTLMEPYLLTASTADDPLNGQLYLDLKTYLPEDILVKVDRMSMAVSLEARVPLLDSHLVAWVARLPGRFKLKYFTSKWMLKEAMKSILPTPILHREKQGFSIPMKNWLRGELRPFLVDHLSRDALNRHGLFRWDIVSQWIDEHLKFHADHAHRLWALVMFQLWWDKMISSPLGREGGFSSLRYHDVPVDRIRSRS